MSRTMISQTEAPKAPRMLLFILSFVFLLPISITVGDVGISANYSFFVLLLLLRPRSDWPRLLQFVIVYALICYLFSLATDSSANGDFRVRQFASLLIFCGMILVMFVPPMGELTDLARAVAIVSACYGLWVVGALVLSGTPVVNPFMVKAELVDWVPDWPQRFIMVVNVGFFLALYLAARSPKWIIAAGLSGFCIVVSQGRAAYIASLVGVSLLAVAYLRQRDFGKLRDLSKALAISFGIFLAFAGKDIGDYFASERVRADGTVSLIEELQRDRSTLVATNSRSDGIWIQRQSSGSRLGRPLTEMIAPRAALNDSPESTRSVSSSQADIERCYEAGGEASGRVRIQIWKNLASFMIDQRMWLGSGFAGPYLFDPAIGSAHSQYVDILFRAGPVGLAIYIGIWFVLLRRCFGHSLELGCGTLTLFVYGFFHETTKYSYGAYLFASLFALSWFGWTRARDSEISSSPE